MKLLLHTCCAPCVIYPASEAKNDKIDVTGFFYNPNIHPTSEYLRRKKTSEDYFELEGIKLISPEYNSGDYFFAMGTPHFLGTSRESGVSPNEAPPGRCSACWNMRLKETAHFAKENGFDAFTTTLLGSPYQDHDVLKKICEALACEIGTQFYYKDFRVGFRRAHNEARKMCIYCQNYCGCVFSLVERQEAKK